MLSIISSIGRLFPQLINFYTWFTSAVSFKNKEKVKIVCSWFDDRDDLPIVRDGFPEFEDLMGGMTLIIGNGQYPELRKRQGFKCLVVAYTYGDKNGFVLCGGPKDSPQNSAELIGNNFLTGVEKYCSMADRIKFKGFIKTNKVDIVESLALYATDEEFVYNHINYWNPKKFFSGVYDNSFTLDKSSEIAALNAIKEIIVMFSEDLESIKHEKLNIPPHIFKEFKKGWPTTRSLRKKRVKIMLDHIDEKLKILQETKGPWGGTLKTLQ